MVTAKIKELSAAKARIEQLEKQVASELHKELAQLPSQYGFDDVNSFIRAIKTASGKRRGRLPRAEKVTTRRKRATITHATRALVKKLVRAGKTGSQIAEKAGISLPSVQNIKKALGLVKGHAKATSNVKSKRTKKVTSASKAGLVKKASSPKLKERPTKKVDPRKVPTAAPVTAEAPAPALLV